MQTKMLVLLFITSQVAGCTIPDKQLKKGWWKYGDGFYLGDGLKFNDGNFKNDTIYQDEAPVAVIIKRAKKFPDNAREITIQSLVTHETGRYLQK